MQNKKNKVNYLSFAFKILVSTCLFIFIIKMVKIDDFSLIFNKISPQSYLYSFILSVLSFLFLSLKWCVLVKNISLIDGMKYSVIGYFYSLIIPVQIAGDGIKAVRVDTSTNTTSNTYLILLIDKLIGFFCICILAFLALLIPHDIYPKQSIVIFFLCSLLFAILLFLILHTRVFFQVIKKVETLFAYVSKKKVQFPQGLMIESYLPIKSVSMSILFALTGQVLSSMSSYALSLSLGLSIPFIDWFIIIGILNFVLLLPVTIAGIGLRDGTLVVLFALYKISADPAIAISLIGLSFQVIIGLFGLVLELTEIIRRKK